MSPALLQRDPAGQFAPGDWLNPQGFFCRWFQVLEIILLASPPIQKAGNVFPA